MIFASRLVECLRRPPSPAGEQSGPSVASRLRRAAKVTIRAHGDAPPGTLRACSLTPIPTAVPLLPLLLLPHSHRHLCPFATEYLREIPNIVTFISYCKCLAAPKSVIPHRPCRFG